MTNAEPIANALGRPQRTADGWKASCPVQDHGRGRGDHTPSLSLRDSDDGKVLLRCHAGCSNEAVIAELENRGLWERGNGATKPAPRKHAPPAIAAPAEAPSEAFIHSKHGNPTGRWCYRSASGEVLGYAVRFDTADGKQVLPLTFLDGRWQWRAPPQPRPLLNLYELAQRPTAPVLVAEGEKAAAAASKLLPDFVTTTSPGGSSVAHTADWSPLQDRQVVVWPDADEPGRKYAADVAKLAQDAGAQEVKIISPPDGMNSGWDAANAEADGWDANRALALISKAEARSNRPTSGLRALRLDELFEMEIRPREYVIEPILPEKGLAMIHAYRGVGKTFAALSIAVAVARGGSALGRWQAPKPRRVLFIDGEMALSDLQQRLAWMVNDSEVEPPPENLHILAADAQDIGLPDLSAAEGREAIEPLVSQADLIILDNLSTLFRSTPENDADEWGEIQDWLLWLRRRGKSVLQIHHEGKGGQQRGTSRREDCLDAVVKLSRPAGHGPEEGAKFKVQYKKLRGVAGDSAKEFEAWLRVEDDRAEWSTRDLVDVELEQVAELIKSGESIRKASDILDIPKSTVHRLKRRAEAAGLLSGTPS